jgi:hypothetical protein
VSLFLLEHISSSPHCLPTSSNTALRTACYRHLLVSLASPSTARAPTYRFARCHRQILLPSSRIWSRPVEEVNKRPPLSKRKLQHHNASFLNTHLSTSALQHTLFIAHPPHPLLNTRSSLHAPHYRLFITRPDYRLSISNSKDVRSSGVQ